MLPARSGSPNRCANGVAQRYGRVPKSPRINSRTTPRTICAPTRTTRAPAAWGPTQQPLSTPNCAYTASAACALRMHRSCPGPVSANTNATVDAIAERAADLLARSNDIDGIGPQKRPSRAGDATRDSVWHPPGRRRRAGGIECAAPDPSASASSSSDTCW